MRVRVLSDLHLEFEPRGPLSAAVEWRYGHGGLPSVDADLVVLAGDIALGAEGVAWARRTFEQPVIYVAGNHEFYSQEYRQTRRALLEAARDEPGGRIHVLEDRACVIETARARVRVVGATLWTDFQLAGESCREGAMFVAEHSVSDYSVVRFDDHASGVRRLRATDTAAMHARSRAFLDRTLAESFAGPTIVVTHMLPSVRSLTPRWHESPLNPSFASDLEDLIQRHQPALWIHGHTHDSCDYAVGNTRVVCNPRGYVPRQLNPRFDPALVVVV